LLEEGVFSRNPRRTSAAAAQQSDNIAHSDGKIIYRKHVWYDFPPCQAEGVVFVREPRKTPYGTVVVFREFYGNLWDLLQPQTTAVAVQ
jgi:hypothetical protein